MTREKSQAVLRALFVDAQDAVKPPAGIEHVALTAVDELERALARNAILEQKVKRLEHRIAAADGAMQGMARKLMAFYEANPGASKIITALNEEAALGHAIADAEREKKAAPYKSRKCSCGQSVQRRFASICDYCKKWTCEGCHKDFNGKCAHCGFKFLGTEGD